VSLSFSFSFSRNRKWWCRRGEKGNKRVEKKRKRREEEGRKEGRGGRKDKDEEDYFDKAYGEVKEEKTRWRRQDNNKDKTIELFLRKGGSGQQQGGGRGVEGEEEEEEEEERVGWAVSGRGIRMRKLPLLLLWSLRDLS
jgi:hypothetical protein